MPPGERQVASRGAPACVVRRGAVSRGHARPRSRRRRAAVPRPSGPRVGRSAASGGRRPGAAVRRGGRDRPTEHGCRVRPQACRPRSSRRVLHARESGGGHESKAHTEMLRRACVQFGAPRRARRGGTVRPGPGIDRERPAKIIEPVGEVAPTPRVTAGRSDSLRVSTGLGRWAPRGPRRGEPSRDHEVSLKIPAAARVSLGRRRAGTYRRSNRDAEATRGHRGVGALTRSTEEIRLDCERPRRRRDGLWPLRPRGGHGAQRARRRARRGGSGRPGTVTVRSDRPLELVVARAALDEAGRELTGPSV